MTNKDRAEMNSEMEAANNRAGRAGVMANKLGGNQMTKINRAAQELVKNTKTLEGINRIIETNMTQIKHNKHLKQNKHHTQKQNIVFKNETMKTLGKLYEHEDPVAAQWRLDFEGPHRSVNSFR
jgi:hypothetical protein